jgi:hypothetical protein
MKNELKELKKAWIMSATLWGGFIFTWPPKRAPKRSGDAL